MRANSVQREPELQRFWEKHKVYETLLKTNPGVRGWWFACTTGMLRDRHDWVRSHETDKHVELCFCRRSSPSMTGPLMQMGTLLLLTLVVQQTHFYAHALCSMSTMQVCCKHTRNGCTTMPLEWQELARKGLGFNCRDTHLGHALNKILKSIIVQYQLLRGRRARYVPGWDCHGLPIELKVLQSMSGAPPVPDTKGPVRSCPECASEWYFEDGASICASLPASTARYLNGPSGRPCFGYSTMLLCGKRSIAKCVQPCRC